MVRPTEADIEAMVLEWFAALGYATVHGPDIAPSEPGAERASFNDVVLEGRLRSAVARLNPKMPADAQDEAVRKVLRVGSPSLVATNRAFHAYLRDGVPVEYARTDGSIAGDLAQIVDFECPEENDWAVVNQFAIGGRRPDILVFLNGLPLAIFELKSAVSENATVQSAFQQLQTYKNELPQLFAYNELLIVSDAIAARVGSLTASYEWFKVWRELEAEKASVLELHAVVHGVFKHQGFLDLLRYFIAFEDDGSSGRVHKIVAGYHQFHAVNAAVEETVRASGGGLADSATNPHAVTAYGRRAAEAAAKVRASEHRGDRRVGVVWHTQGSGKSFSMLFYAARVVAHPAMANPTIVVLTDRNDLDDQLFGQFQRCHELLRQMPVQATSVDHLRTLLKVASGGVVFTTIQKFLGERETLGGNDVVGSAESPGRDQPQARTVRGRMPELSARRNIVVIADEAHRSQYDLIDGLARNLRDALPNASFIGFTGTPIEKSDANTRAVFGDYISIYDIQRAVADGATVPIYYESRIAKLSLNASALPEIDEEFDEITEGEEDDRKQKLKSKWAALEALVGDEHRLATVAKDLVAHLERRAEVLDGKVMIVCMSRRICVALLDALLKLRPEWASVEGDDEAAEAKKHTVAKVIMTGSADDGPAWQAHIRNKAKRRELANRFKDPDDPFKIVIVRDMWLTGFDAPCLHTMYLDKPMRGHGLMQAIARVNRVFRDKPGGLVVDYLGIADQLKQALATYTDSGGSGAPANDNSDALAVLEEKHEVACSMLHGLDWGNWVTGTVAERLALLPEGQERILVQERGKERFIAVVRDCSRAFALCGAVEEAMPLRDDISYFQAIAAQLAKTSARARPEADLDHAIRQLVAKAIVADEGVIDVFTAAGLRKPDIGILSEEFLTEVRGLKHKNVAAELLAKLLKDELKVRGKKNVVQSRQFSEMLQTTLLAYHNRAIATQEVIEELITLAKKLDAATKRGEDLGLSDDEIAFYDALAANESAVKAMGNHELRVIAAELVTSVRKNVSIDWNLRENVRAKIRVMVKRILRKHGYPPDLQDDATRLVLEQAATLCDGWV